MGGGLVLQVINTPELILFVYRLERELTEKFIKPLLRQSLQMVNTWSIRLFK